MLKILNDYAHGFVFVPVAVACKRHGLFDNLNPLHPTPFIDLVTKLHANSGHLRVALNMLESLNWVTKNDRDEYWLTSAADLHQKIPEDIMELMSFPIDDYLKDNPKKLSLKKWIQLAGQRWNIGDPVFAYFLDGILVMPLLLALKEKDLFAGMDDLNASLFSKINPIAAGEMIELFSSQGWLLQQKGVAILTDTGRFIADRIFITATVASYKPLLLNISEVIFGDCISVFKRDQSGHELHLDRSLNVRGSGFQHEKYFADLEAIILAVFNREPFAKQPKYIADMGCGDGTLLKRIYEIIQNKSLRGKALQEYPLKLIGIDYNERALEETARTLKDFDHMVLKGDIGDPEQMIVDLKKCGIQDPENILHVRSFLDHDRPYLPPADISREKARSCYSTDMVFVDSQGGVISSTAIIQSLVEHLERWSKVLGNYGLIILEVHCLEPKTINQFIDKCESLHFDAYHRFSHQLLVSADLFLTAAAETGLFPSPGFFRKYPKTLPFSRITLNYFERRNYRIRSARVNDLKALEQLENECWEPDLRTPVSVLKKRMQRFPEGQLVLEMDDKVVGVLYSQRIANSEALKTASIKTVDQLHDQDGSIIQLLGVNILPGMQHSKLGDQLLEFMLQRCSLMNTVSSAVGVSRCKDYSKHPKIPIQEYIFWKNEHGKVIDPTLRFHELHGAQIQGVIPNYRPLDKKNKGYGVLLEYNLYNRQRNDFEAQGRSSGKQVLAPAINPSASMKNFVEKTILNILGKVKADGFRPERPLMEMGLDSADLLELAEQLSHAYQLQLEPTFFFQYNTPIKIISFLQEQVQPGEAAPKPKPLHDSENTTSTEEHIENIYDSYSHSRENFILRGPYQSDRSNTKLGVDDFIEKTIRFILGQTAPDVFTWERPLMEMGLDSADLLELNEQICHQYQISLEPTFFFQYNTAGKIGSYLQQQMGLNGRKVSTLPENIQMDIGYKSQLKEQTVKFATGKKEIAIIGIACRLPGGVSDKEKLWELLVNNQDAIRKLDLPRWDWPATITPETEHRGIDQGGFLKSISEFDPLFFRISPKEAELMDPQQRILLELSWECLEDSGYPAKALSGSRTGVFIGASGSDYSVILNENIEEMDPYFGMGTHLAVLPNRISYFYNLHGPSIQIDTACSSSLVAVHEAIKSLQLGECDRAFVGGINIICRPTNSIVYYKAGMISKDGKCKTFDKDANGYVRGEGGVMLFLKPLAQALNDQDNIYAVIKNTAINHGGQAGGLTVPNPEKQSALLVEAYQAAGIEPETVGYIEAHGTGTSLGDPIEVNGLKMAFSQLSRTKEQIDEPYCGLGSIKTNIGHLEAAAGLAGLMKVVLSLRYRTLPATLNFRELNPFIDLRNTPFYIVHQNRTWELPAGQLLRRAGVSSFGSGGTNAHVILEEAPAVSRLDPVELPGCLICLSAKTEEALQQKVQDLILWLEKERRQQYHIFDISAALLLGREHFEIRVACVVKDLPELQERLKQILKVHPGTGEAFFKGNKLGKTLQIPLIEFGNTLIQELQIASNPEYTAKATSLAELYANGYDLDWEAIYPENRRSPVSLPAYPFAKEPYWVSQHQPQSAGIKAKITAIGESSIHPLLHQDTSYFSGEGLESNLTRTLESQAIQTGKKEPGIDENGLKTVSIKHLRELIGQVTKIPNHRLNPERHFEELGFDSIMISNLNQAIEKWIGRLEATLFFKYNSIRTLGTYLAETYPEAVIKLMDAPGESSFPPNSVSAFSTESSALISLRSAKTNERLKTSPLFNGECPNEIAIIGIAGRYPKAVTLEQFWRNLCEGMDCIEEIPPKRWSLKGFFEPDRAKAVANGLSYSKWGGFLDDIDCFDPLFFNISPKDAMVMDPQERLFLEVAWECLEDAGYTRKSLEKEGYGNEIGVFVGATFNNYQLFMAEAASRANRDLYPAYSQIFSIANRVSYVMNFTGPSLTVDTACSSSLYAIHLACESIMRGQSRMAMAGGVNLSLHPSKYIMLSQEQFSATDGKCHAFCEGGTGYVPAEAVGAVFLKPLGEAIADNDYIYGVIKGTASSHGGRTNGFFVPSPVSQSLAIEKALRQSQVHPRSISFIEAHGTGTALGDPIEITGLTDVFQKYTRETGFCSISSVKSNMGHAEAAAGVAQLTKALLQIKYQTLVKNVMHGRGPNPNIDFLQTPFVLQDKTEYWSRPVIDGREIPRRAGISSFGAGGSNVHMIIEEYIAEPEEPVQITNLAPKPVIFVLSAKNEPRLKEYAQRVLTAIREREFPDSRLADIAYTFQVGREAMEERVATLVGSVKELAEKLQGFIENREEIPDFYYGKVRRNQEVNLPAAEDPAQAIEALLNRAEYGKLVDFWLKGLNFDWNLLYGNNKPRRISLPSYPFAKERYWVPENDPQSTDRAFKLMTYEEVWQEQVLPDTKPVQLKNLVCFLSNPEYQQAVLKTIQPLEPSLEVVFVSESAAYQKLSKQKYEICPANLDTYRQVFQSILDDYGNVDAVLYLWALDGPRYLDNYSVIFNVLQAFALTKLKPARLLLAGRFTNGLERSYLESWIGFERSLGLVLPNTQVAVISEAAGERRQEGGISGWIRKLLAELQSAKMQSVSYQNGKRYVKQVRPGAISPGASLLRTGGTYLITGGCGGLGFLFAEFLAQNYGANLILSGRSVIDAEKEAKIKRLETLGGIAMYIRADVCDITAMKEGLNQAKQRFGRVQGVIHAAGIADQQNILEKEYSSFQKVLDPKIKGTLALDELLGGEGLDFNCYFSSAAAILGDFGSCDYSIANRFLMAYADYRNQQPQGQIKGKTVVINWPLWKDGGMNLGAAENTEMYLKSSGQRLLEAEEGLAIFEEILSQAKTQFLILVGQPARIERFLGLTQDQTGRSAPVISSSPGTGRRNEMKGLSTQQCLEWDLKEQISKLLQIPRHQLEDTGANLADFGFDSVSLGEFAACLTGHYGIEITPALFFGYSTIEKLIQYFLTNYPGVTREFYREDLAAPIRPEASQEALFGTTATELPQRRELSFKVGRGPEEVPEPVAIIGMSGRFPEARNIEEMWTILAEGRNTVTEIPSERFDWRQYYGEPGGGADKFHCRWCACIPGVREFDPLFFEISPKEAETMDPRQRLLMQEAWNALEDAGYGAVQIKNNKIGMFVGAEQGDYQLLVRGRDNITSNHNGILAARLAYFLNLSGPVMAIDTACASGLVAAHQACLSLHNHECDTAIAAGVNLLLTPEIFRGMSQAGMLSSDGKCFAFDKRANGMVPGEAVVVVVLKLLSKAEADGDPIYAVIRGSGINYDGKTNGLTAPSGVAQTNLLKTVYDQYQINPEEVEYIITHGTGTKLGDPIEINALYDAFKCNSHKTDYCALTSTKTNFGHTFAASGLVSLMSLVQALRHEAIPPSLHCEQVNDYINWKESPFYINTSLKPWVENEKSRTGGASRMGAVSAFGMSGTNAHLVVQSYPRGKTDNSFTGGPFYLLALSAKTQEALEEKISELILFLGKNASQGQDLLPISYTLLEGRQHFEYRCAIVVRDWEDAIYLFKQAGGKEKLPNLFRGKVPRNFTGQKVLQQYAVELLKQAQSCPEDRQKYQEILYALAELYCQGYELNWNLLFGDPRPHRVNLPAYPFAREHYWAPDTKKQFETGQSTRNYQLPFDDTFYDQLIDDVLNDAISIEDAVKKNEGLNYGIQLLGFGRK